MHDLTFRAKSIFGSEGLGSDCISRAHSAIWVKLSTAPQAKTKFWSVDFSSCGIWVKPGKEVQDVCLRSCAKLDPKRFSFCFSLFLMFP